MCRPSAFPRHLWRHVNDIRPASMKLRPSHKNMSTHQEQKPVTFESSGQAGLGDFSPRHGRLYVPCRTPIDTPNFIAVSSRGAVPHLSQDMMRDQTSVKGIYAAVEDFLEKATSSDAPVVSKCPVAVNESPLRKFIALQRDALLVLGPRRIPPVPCSPSSTSTAISVVTSLGFRLLECADYVKAVQNFRPDIVVGMSDILFGHKPGVKRMEVMGDRTLNWVEVLATELEEQGDGSPGIALFAPVLPIDREVQSWYLNALRDELSEKISGIALYEMHSVEAVPQNLQHLPKIFIGDVDGPHKLLDAVSVGIDIFTVPFVTTATEAGIALNFSFDPKAALTETAQEGEESLPLGLDLWSTAYATDLLPLSKSCQCYTCINHHRAYVQHLLNAREMLGWVLLQIHNHHILEMFFRNVRAHLKNGDFDQEKEAFKDRYQRELPTKTGDGPRVRGYTFKSEGRGEPRKNPVAWQQELGDEKARLADGTLLVDDHTADLEGEGFTGKTGTGNEPPDVIPKLLR